MSRLACPRCLRPRSYCLCSVTPKLISHTRVLILQDPREAKHALNTARLACLGLVHAARVVAQQFDERLWARAGWDVYLLFPGSDETSAGPISVVSTKQRLLVVPDGTWRQVRAMIARSPTLAALPRLDLRPTQASRYRIRHADMPGALSTVEAIVQALNVLEGPARFDALLAPMEQLVQGQIDAMGLERYQQHHLRRRGARS